MRLEGPPEPAEVKKWILEVRKRLGPSEGNDWDSLAVWYGNRIPKYLWSVRKSALVREGFTWQRFLRLLKYRTDDALLWGSGAYYLGMIL
jgi:hypothetical protein